MKQILSRKKALHRTWLLLTFGCLLSVGALAQQPYYEWRIGGGIGVMAYHGDVSYRLNTKQVSFPAYTVFLEKKLSPSFGLQLNGSLGQVTANDRTRNWKGNTVTDNPDFGRALNFKTDIRAASLLLHYYFDNGKLLSEYSRFAPFLYAGVGVTDFTVYGDLFDANGNRYHYWSDQTIRSQAEGTAGNVPEIGQDGKFETRLSGLMTEGNNYPTTVLSIPAGIGLKIKLADQLSLSWQLGATYAFTDYLDDVSGVYPAGGFDNELQAYASNPSGVIRQPRGEEKANRDWYLSSFITLNYHFGYKTKDFKAPLVYTGYRQAPPVAPKEANAPSGNQSDAHSNTMLPAGAFRKKPPVEQKLSPTQPVPNEVKREVPSDIKGAPAPVTPEPNQQLTTEQNEDRPANIPYSSQSLADREKVRTDSIRNQVRQQERTSTDGRQNPLAAGRTDNSFVQDRKDSIPSSVRSGQPGRQGTTANTDQNVRSLNSNQQTRPQDQPAYSNQNTAADRRREQDRARYSNQNARTMTATQPTRQQSSTTTYVPLPIPTGAGRSSRTDTVVLKEVSSANVTQMQNDLVRLRADLAALRGQNDPATNRKLDSLMTLVAALDRQATKNIRAKYGADTLEARVDSVTQLAASSDTMMIASLRGQIEGLNQSLAELRSESNKEALKNYGSTVVYFGVNKSDITAADKQRLQVLVDKLRQSPGVRVNIKGYTDQTGNPEYNLQLSRKRAESIVRYLTEEKGVDRGKILVNYFGQANTAKPGVKNNPYQRKVELELFVD
jgi:outer membrane protein OmpA-like peptidoglycan-associated protein